MALAGDPAKDSDHLGDVLYSSAKEYCMILKRSCTIALLLGLICLAGTAWAETLSLTLATPPLVAEGVNQIQCHLVNVSSEERSVVIEVFAPDGTLLLSDGGTLNPGASAVVSVPASTSPRYCKFVVEGWYVHFRGSIAVRMPGLGSLGALPAR
jgi:hypothetical protein